MTGPTPGQVLDARIASAGHALRETAASYAELVRERLTARLREALPAGGSLSTEEYAEAGEIDVAVVAARRPDGTPYWNAAARPWDPDALGDSYDVVIEDLRSLHARRYDTGDWRRGEETFDF